MYRRMSIAVKVDRWDWKNVQKKDTVDITSMCVSFTWQKTIKVPDSAATIDVIPQRNDFNVLDDINTMDVVNIYEFNMLKWQGFIKRISFTGYINGTDGKPGRFSTLHCDSIGKLFSSGSLGLGLGDVGTRAANATAFLNAAVSLQGTIKSSLADGVSYKECITGTIAAWKDLMRKVGAVKAATFLDAYLVTDIALDDSSASVIPRTLTTFTGAEKKIDLWSILSPLIEMPLNECWFDVSPRNFFLSGTTIVSVSDNMTHLVLRPTPFNGKVIAGVQQPDVFTSVPNIVLPNKYLTRFDVNKSIDEVFSVYDVVPCDFQFSDEVRYLAGQVVVDTEAVSKYLLKLLLFQPMYTRTADFNETKGAELANIVNDYAVDLAMTFSNWYKKNDQYLSGVISYMAPDELTPARSPQKDPRIGERLSLAQLTGSFYIEGLAHTWKAQGPLVANATVTRGYAYEEDQAIVLSQKLFRSGLFTRTSKLVS